MATYSDLMQMCRLCLVKDQVSLPIFGGQGDIQQIFLKITACLPVKVSREDNLPKSICDGCSYKLDLLYQFWNTSSNSEKQLIDWLTAAGVDPKHKSLEPIGLATQPNVILKQEPVTELDNISSDTQNYLMQQQQLAYKPEEYEEPQQDPIKSTKQKATSDSADETPSKRPRRVTRNTKSVQEVDDSEEDYGDNTESGIAKTEDESEEEEDEEDEDDGDDGDDGDDMADPDFITAEEEEDTDQPGPSGVSGNKSASATKTKKKRKGVLRRQSPTKSGSINCEVCSMTFKNERGLQVHAKKHIGNYNCSLCSEGFKKPLDIILHARHAHGGEDLPYECTFCDFKTENPNEIAQHLNTKHDKVPKYTCTTCKKGFNVYSWFTEHANFHTGEKPFVCELCGKAFPYSRYLSAHKTSMHFQDQHGYAKVHECVICKKTYQHRNSLLVHMNSHTGNVAICDICGKTLSSKEKLKLHYRIHTGYKPFKCIYCEKAFTKKTILVEHVRIHTGEKPYQCEYCQKSFSQRTSLVIHIRSHTGERPYVCHICNKGFVARAMLNIHFKSCRGFDQQMT